jgi:hypothetical protein
MEKPQRLRQIKQSISPRIGFIPLNRHLAGDDLTAEVSDIVTGTDCVPTAFTVKPLGITQIIDRFENSCVCDRAYQKRLISIRFGRRLRFDYERVIQSRCDSSTLNQLATVEGADDGSAPKRPKVVRRPLRQR